MPCTTISSGTTPCGRASKCGEMTWRTPARRPVAGSIRSGPESVMQVAREAGVEHGEQTRDKDTIECSGAAYRGDGSTEPLHGAEVEQVGADQRAEAAADVSERRRAAAGQRHGDDGRSHGRHEDRQGDAEARNRLREEMTDCRDECRADRAQEVQAMLEEQIERRSEEHTSEL